MGVKNGLFPIADGVYIGSLGAMSCFQRGYGVAPHRKRNEGFHKYRANFLHRLCGGSRCLLGYFLVAVDVQHPILGWMGMTRRQIVKILRIEVIPVRMGDQTMLDFGKIHTKTKNIGQRIRPEVQKQLIIDQRLERRRIFLPPRALARLHFSQAQNRPGIPSAAAVPRN